MEKKLKLQIEEIDRKYNSLLSKVGCKNPDYTIYLDPCQCSGFGAENSETMYAMKRISSYDTMPLLDFLADATRGLDRAYRFDSVSF